MLAMLDSQKLTNMFLYHWAMSYWGICAQESDRLPNLWHKAISLEPYRSSEFYVLFRE
jgi:hypothetical protein